MKVGGISTNRMDENNQHTSNPKWPETGAGRGQRGRDAPARKSGGGDCGGPRARREAWRGEIEASAVKLR